ncbi:MAG: hypothetical protein US75_C0011G0014 [Candidatus Woesebacteria bacterium GW2011_GWC1_38_13]|uniref:Uncharacterized protein n=2 Tax=Candidatus Woeseibacteriota TaxID=1752722 RepID=A0A0G0IMQ3_9BACT|nr:MAG: hypothetical protein US67_C0002G0024 [Candidatus Woesebacteria bacterium GW2011_GWD1_38_10]KKQ55997.1 MAG: hypothetical protein US75_C0011G0014 [Candidatus Woesebacteria bacterium GW2011_GWC1_38_13]
MASEQHQQLVKALMNALINQNRISIDNVALEGYATPPNLNGYIPDIYGHDPVTGLVVLGEAKTTDDIDSQNSQSQYIAFSSRIMSSGPQQGKVVPLHVIVPKDGESQLKATLYKLGLSNKIGLSIYIWTM